MNYYKIIPSSDPQIIGVNNGICQAEWMEEKYSKEELEHLYQFFKSRDWNYINKKPDFTSTYHAKLLKKATLTDFLQFSPYMFACPFLISSRVKIALGSYHIQEYFLFPAILYGEEGKILTEDYSLFYMPLQEFDVVNFDKSIFYTQLGIHKENRKYLSFKNIDQYKSFSGGIKQIEKLVLNEDFDKTLDLFETRLGGMFISEYLKDWFELSEFTGINILGDEYVPRLEFG